MLARITAPQRPSPVIDMKGGPSRHALAAAVTGRHHDRQADGDSALLAESKAGRARYKRATRS